MVELSVQLSPESAKKLAKFSKGQIFRNILTATHKAGTSAARKIRRESTIEIEQRKMLESGFIRTRHFTVRPSRGGDDSPTWSVTVDGEALPVSMFKPTQTGTGVMFRANRDAYSKIEGAFMVKLKGGHVGVFQRDARSGQKRVPYKGKDGKRNTKSLPIREVFTSGVSSGLKVATVRDRVMELGAKQFERTFLRVIKLDQGNG